MGDARARRVILDHATGAPAHPRVRSPGAAAALRHLEALDAAGSARAWPQSPPPGSALPDV